MKKHILLSIVLGLGLLLFARPSQSQHFQIVASFGTAHQWSVPNAVLYEIDYYYPFHQIVHIDRVRRGRNLFFNVILERRGQFVEVNFGRHARILRANYLWDYPLAQHICNTHCGFHGNFYNNFRVACNTGHGNYHNHNHHNHISYNRNRFISDRNQAYTQRGAQLNKYGSSRNRGNTYHSNGRNINSSRSRNSRSAEVNTSRSSRNTTYANNSTRDSRSTGSTRIASSSSQSNNRGSKAVKRSDRSSSQRKSSTSSQSSRGKSRSASSGKSRGQ